MTLIDCKSCTSHVLHSHGYVICNYWNTREQRITADKDGNKPFIVHCPREQEKPARVRS